MADTSVASANRVQQWADEYFVEFVRDNRFKRYMGTDENSIIQVKEELTKEAGDRITISLVTRLTGTAITGDNTLEGNEESLGNYGHLVTVEQYRNGVVVGNKEKIKTKIDLLNAAKKMLKLWQLEHLRDMIIDRLMSPHTDGLTEYASATEAQKDAWETANNPTDTNQRIIFGAALTNSTLDHSAGLANVDSTSDDLSPDMLSLAKRQAQTCDPHIRPIRVNDDEEWFVAFAGSRVFRDLESNMSTIHQNAAPRSMDDNPLFKPGDLVSRGVIIREVPEIPVIAGVGNGSIDVSPVFFCGAQAAALCFAERPKPKMDEFDYQNKRGVAISGVYGVEKLNYNSIQHGMVTLYAAAVGD